jgi:energy-converting hydrogenase Eha subunit H
MQPKRVSQLDWALYGAALGVVVTVVRWAERRDAVDGSFWLELVIQVAGLALFGIAAAMISNWILRYRGDSE